MIKTHLTALFAVGVLALSGCTKNTDPTDEDEGADEVGPDEGSDKTDNAENSEADGDGDADTGNTMFVPDDDDLGGAASCDPWAQDCPEGEKCVAYDSTGDTWDATKCVPIMGAGVTGDECTYDGATLGTDDCDLGYMCYYTNMDGIGSCVPLCTGGPDDPLCPDNFNCSISNEGSLLLCLYSCNPLLQDCEQDMSGCFWDGSLFNCDPAGDLLEGDACAYINDCSQGHVCLEAESLPNCIGSACCSGFCDLDDPQCQLEDTECVAFFEEGGEPPGLENVGICALAGA